LALVLQPVFVFNDSGVNPDALVVAVARAIVLWLSVLASGQAIRWRSSRRSSPERRRVSRSSSRPAEVGSRIIVRT
jgi:hypothetical protein